MKGKRWKSLKAALKGTFSIKNVSLLKGKVGKCSPFELIHPNLSLFPNDELGATLKSLGIASNLIM